MQEMSEQRGAADVSSHSLPGSSSSRRGARTNATLTATTVTVASVTSVVHHTPCVFHCGSIRVGPTKCWQRGFCLCSSPCVIIGGTTTVVSGQLQVCHACLLLYLDVVHASNLPCRPSSGCEKMLDFYENSLLQVLCSP
jgi:hypothetical protein